jgi:hypothetical protein
MGFWDKVGGKVGGAAKWITDPKQLLTAAGFALGGPVGAGIGRSVGGMVPQSVGPVPWGALGADTDEFRQSTLADGLQWGDVGQAGKDFVSGYSAGRVGQQIPGIQDLEGAFGGGGGAFGGDPGALPGGSGALQPDTAITNTMGAPPPGYGQPGAIPQPSAPTFSPLQPDTAITNTMGAPPPGYGQPGAIPQPSAPTFSRYFPLQPDTAITNTMGGAPPPTPQAPGFAPSPYPSDIGRAAPGYGYGSGADFGNVGIPGQMQPTAPPSLVEAMGNQGGTMFPENMGSSAPLGGVDYGGGRRTAQNFTDQRLLEKTVDQGKGFWGGMSGIEKIYAMNALASAGAGIAGSFGGGTKGIGQGGTNLLGDMGLFSPTQRRQVSSFDDWRSRR